MSLVRSAGRAFRALSGAEFDKSANAAFLVTAVFLCIVFVLGGASRGDLVPLVLLRPLSVLVLGYALLQLRPELIRQHRLLLGMALAALLLPLLQLVPLPPALWQALPGRALVADADRIAGIGAVWRPISLAPDQTWNALFALATPAAALLLTLTLPTGLRAQTSTVLLAIGLVSGLLGILQLVGTVGDSLPYYEARGNHNAAVGLFANRNHSAVFLACLFPILAGMATSARGYRVLIAGAATIVLVPLIIATGSRAGVAIGAIGFALSGALLLGERARRAPPGARRQGSRIWIIAAGIGVLALIGIAALVSRGEAWTRLLSSGSAGEKRLIAWPVVADLARANMPLGSGFGSFDPVFRAGEPLSLLAPTYLNHAHNDWLELWMTGGIPAVLLLASAVIAYLVATWRVWAQKGATTGRSALLARIGSVVLLLLALASIVDYPLRTPSLSMLAAIAAAWLALGQGQPRVVRERQKDFGKPAAA